ncbi:MAG: glycosyltransferase [Chitinivibrionales bacterium]|nr:glycosyltransferase [Chitinivibrionales bacterium]
MSTSSIPQICGCASRIASRSVVPDRAQPQIVIGGAVKTRAVLRFPRAMIDGANSLLRTWYDMRRPIYLASFALAPCLQTPHKRLTVCSQFGGMLGVPPCLRGYIAMRILLTDLYGGPAGSTMSVSYLARGLAQRGHAVWVLCPPGSLLQGLLSADDVTVVPLEVSGKLDIASAKRVHRLVADNAIDIVDVQASKDRYMLSWAKLFHGLRIPVVHTRRQYPRSAGGWLHRTLYVWSTERIIVISDGLKRIFVDKHYPEKHLHVIHNGVPANRYRQWSPERVAYYRETLGLGPACRVIGCVSRMKEQQQILEAVALLRDPSLVLLFAGIPQGSLDRRARRLGLPNRIVYAGFVDNDEILNIYRLLDVNILASTMDGFGLVLLEAMAMRCPVIGTAFGGITDVIQDNVNGLLFPDGDVAALADRIRRALTDEALRHRLIDNGRHTAHETFTIERTIDGHEALFRRLVHAPAADAASDRALVCR